MVKDPALKDRFLRWVEEQFEGPLMDAMTENGPLTPAPASGIVPTVRRSGHEDDQAVFADRLASMTRLCR